MSSTPERFSMSASSVAELEQLLEQRELLDATELVAQMGHCQWDYNNYRLLSCSQGYARIFNMSVEEIIEQQSTWESSLSQIVPEDRDHFEETYYSQQESGSYTVEYRFLRNDGEIRWLRESGMLRFEADGEVIDAFAIIQDITVQVAHQNELEDGQELARQVEAITDIGHFVNDEVEDKFLYISPGYARIHGHSVDSFMKFVESRKDNLAAVHAEDRERLRKEIKQYIKHGEGYFESEYRVVRPNGEVPWIQERSISRLKENGHVRLSLGVLQDITEKKNYQQTLQDAKDSLEVTVAERTRQLAMTIDQLQREIKERELVSTELENKNAELERFAYTVSHDLKAPLVTIKGFLGLLDKDLAAVNIERATEDMGKINNAADTMARLLEDLLELSRIGRVVGDLTCCKLSEIAGQALQMVESSVIEHGVAVEIEDMPNVRGDRTRLLEVYQNLLENAIKFRSDKQTPSIHIGAKQRQGKTCFFIRDNGIGIAEEYQGLVFELFERLSLNVEGTGVGLTLVRRIIEVHGGEIWLESEGPGQGCCFWFTLPE